jgi:hypothetical protein
MKIDNFSKSYKTPHACNNALSGSVLIAVGPYLVVVVLFVGPFYINVPVPVAAQSKALVCGHMLAGIEGLNPAGSMAVSSKC